MSSPSPPAGTGSAVAASPAPASPAAAAPLTKFVYSGGVQCHTAEQFAQLRRELKQYGVEQIKNDMQAAGWFAPDPSTGELQLTTGVKPFNPFARLVSGLLPAPYGDHLARLGMDSASARFFVAQNRPELDAQWASADAEWLGKASMAQRHQFLLIKSLSWDTFNCATLGLDATRGGRVAALKEALQLLDDLESTAREYARLSGWSANLGLFFHSFPLNSVHALHLHMLDMDTTGPTFQHLNHKNLPLDAVRQVLRQELTDAEAQPQQEDFHHSSSISSSTPHAHFHAPGDVATPVQPAAASTAASAASATGAVATAARAPFRIPIRLLRPSSLPLEALEAVAPDFLVCLLDQMHTRAQCKARRQNAGTLQQQRQQEDGGSALKHGAAAPGHVTSLRADRPSHDRLPLVLAVTSHPPTPVAPPAAGSSLEPAVGVSHVTLLQPSDAAAWLAAQPAELAERTTMETVALAHASRCPCRAPLSCEEENAEERTREQASGASSNELAVAEAAEPHTAEAASAAPSPARTLPLPVQQQVRLAVVVVPTLLSTLRCARCAPNGATLDTPLPRALLTRRPRSMRAFPASWVFPGGACDPSDLSLSHTGARELREETGLRVSEGAMRLVALWEAVYPVIRPESLPKGEAFQPKARYLITMFAAPVEQEQESGSGAEHSSASACCLGCSSPALSLCPTEVDASVWVSPREMDSLRQHAAYTHTECEDELQRKGAAAKEPGVNQLQAHRCMAGTPTCECVELPAMVTRSFLAENPTNARLMEDATPSSAAATAAASASASPPSPFLPALVRCCVLFGLYPNREGSGVAEGHLVALEEMMPKGMFG